jgi:hypothetical protein
MCVIMSDVAGRPVFVPLDIRHLLYKPIEPLPTTDSVVDETKQSTTITNDTINTEQHAIEYLQSILDQLQMLHNQHQSTSVMDCSTAALDIVTTVDSTDSALVPSFVLPTQSPPSDTSFVALCTSWLNSLLGFVSARCISPLLILQALQSQCQQHHTFIIPPCVSTPVTTPSISITPHNPHDTTNGTEHHTATCTCACECHWLYQCVVHELVYEKEVQARAEWQKHSKTGANMVKTS